MTQIWLAHERSTTWLPGFDPAWLPREARARVSTLISQSRDVGIEVDAWVGSIPLANGDTLRLASKFGDVDFMRMLMKSLGIQIDLDAESLYAASDDPSPLRFAIPPFLRGLRAVEANGLLFTWASTPVVSQHRPTRTRMAATAVKAALGKTAPFVGIEVSRTTDTAEHRVMSLASAVVIRESAGRAMPEPDQRLLHKWVRHGWQPGRIADDLRCVRQRLRSGTYSGSRGYYADTLRLALMLLGAHGISTAGNAEIRSTSFLVNSDRLFEEFVRAVLFDAVRASGLVVEKEKPGHSPLFVDGEIQMEPDILLLRGAAVVGLGDVKHKHPDASDYYQLFTYLRQYNLSQGFIFMASDRPSDPIRHIARRDNVEVVIITLPIGDHAEMERRIADLPSQVQI